MTTEYSGVSTESVQQSEAELGQSEKKLLTPKDIAENIDAGLKWLKTGPFGKQDGRWEQWKRNAKYLRCVWPDLSPSDIAVNSIFANQNTIRPTLYFKNPKISVTPAGPVFQKDELGNEILGPDGKPLLVDNAAAARLFGSKLNYELKEIKFKKTLKKVINDTIAPYGIGWAKVGYQVLTVGGRNLDRDTKVSYWVQRVDPRNLVYHWNCNDVDNNIFFAERLILTRSEAENDYGFRIPKGYVAKLPDFMKDKAESANLSREDHSLVIAWEYYDLTTDAVYWTLDCQSPNSVYDFPKDPDVETYPFEGACYVPLTFNEDNEDIIPVSDVEPVEDQANARNFIRTKQVKHVSWYGTETLYEDQALTETDIDKTKETNHGLYTKVAAGALSGNKIQVRGTPPMGNDNYQMDEILAGDMRETLGITEYQQGSAGAASTKATIGQIVQNSAIVRVEERRDKIHDFVIEIVRRLAAMIQYFGNDEEYINLNGEDFTDEFIEGLKNEYGYNPKIPFLRLPKKDIQGEFSYDFSIEDMIMRPKDVQFQQWTQFFQVATQNPIAYQALQKADISFEKMVKKIAELGGVNLDEVKNTGPAQIPSEKENQMFERGLEVPEPHEGDNHDEHILGHGRTLREFESQLGQLQGQIQQVTAQVQQVQQTANPLDPNAPLQLQQIQQQAQELINGITPQLEQITNIIRKIKIHMQEHEERRVAKEGQLAQPFQGAGPPQGPPQGVPGGDLAAQRGIQQGALPQ